MGLKYEHFFIKFKGLDFEIKLLDDSALFPNSLKEDKNLIEEFKVIVNNKDKEISFKFYNSQMEREISLYLNNLGYVKYNNREFKSFVNRRFNWGGYDKVKNREDLIKQRIINLFYSILNDIAFNYSNDLTSFNYFCDSFGYDKDSRRVEKIFNSCIELQEKLLSLNFDEKFLKYLENEVQQETEKFNQDIIKAIEESKNLN